MLLKYPFIVNTNSVSKHYQQQCFTFAALVSTTLYTYIFVIYYNLTSELDLLWRLCWMKSLILFRMLLTHCTRSVSSFDTKWFTLFWRKKNCFQVPHNWRKTFSLYFKKCWWFIVIADDSFCFRFVKVASWNIPHFLSFYFPLRDDLSSSKVED
jgi:hypothetical protein